MVNIKLLLVFTLFTLSFSIKQSDVGSNDWSLENIGRLSEAHFSLPRPSSYEKRTNNLFFRSERGQFGLINKDTGNLTKRESLNEGERVIASNSESLEILTEQGQIIKYDKNTMKREVSHFTPIEGSNGKVDNYVHYHNLIYIASDGTVKQKDSTTNELVGSNKIVRFFDRESTDGVIELFALTHSEEAHTLNLIKVELKLSTSATLPKFKEFGSFNISISTFTYVEVIAESGDIYIGNEQSHLYINFETKTLKHLASKPVEVSHTRVVLQNGDVFVPRTNENSKLLAIENNNKIFGNVDGNVLILTEGKETIGRINIGNNEFGLLKVWVNKNELELSEVLIQFRDLQLVFYSRRSSNFSEVWSREESLAYVDKVLFMKYEGYADHLNNPYHMKMDDPAFANLSLIEQIEQIPSNIASRVKSEFEDIYNLFIEKLENAANIATKLDQFSELMDLEGYLKGTMSEDKEKQYGLRKYIIVLTKFNTMFALDTKSPQILWKKSYGFDSKLLTLIKLKQEYEKEIAIAISYKEKVTYLTQIHEDGSMTQLKSFATEVEPTLHKISAHSVIIKTNERVHRYDINSEIFGHEKIYGFYEINNQQVTGWQIVGDEVKQTWNLELPTTERLISTTPVYRGQPQSHLPLINDKKVLFKNVDFTNLAVLTLEEFSIKTDEVSKTAFRLHLYIINGQTGTILFNEYQMGIHPDLPFNLVYDEHNVIVTYYSLRNRVYEVWTVEAFQVPNESELISKKYEPTINTNEIFFRSKVYGTVLAVKHIFISESKEGLLRRNVLIVTRENKIYNLPRELLSTRRPKSADADANANSEDAEFISSKYPLEEYILPINPLAYLTYNKYLANLEQMRFSSSDLESTIFIMVYGVDLFLVRSSPDRAFDMLADGFNYVQLIAVMTIATLAALFFKSKLQEAKLKKNYLD